MKVAYSVVFLVLAFTLSIFSGDSYAAIPPQGFPNFSTSVNVEIDVPEGGGLKITAENDDSSDFFFFIIKNGVPTPYKVFNGEFELTATFDSARQLVSGGVAISGLLWESDVLDPPEDLSTNLFSATFSEADLSQFVFTSATPTIGLRTDFDSFEGWAKDYATTDESVYLALNNPNPGDIFDFFENLENGTATTVTTVPVPPAVWLLMSAFASLSVIGRRRSMDSAA